MLIRAIVIFFFSITFSFAYLQDAELMARKITKNGDIVQMSGDVVLYSTGYFLRANSAIYDEKNEILELFGDISIIKDSNEILQANYLKLDLKNKKEQIKDSFLLDQAAELWIRSNALCSDDKFYNLKNSTVSSCNITDPDWKIKFSSGKLNKESKFVHIFNNFFFVKSIPVLYLPYFGFPTDKTRRSGLLIPEFSYSKGDGLYYKQPIYFAPQKSWDLQIDPQVRTRRGAGVFGTFRFVGSPYSYGEIRGGILENRSNYIEENSYKNKKNYGYEFYYNQSKLFGYLNEDITNENLLIDFKYLNDLGYFSLKEKNSENKDPLIKSKLNYYMTSDEDYLGLYARYYLDTRKLNGDYPYKNRDTTLELPTLHYHKFKTPLFLPNLIYSTDLKIHNYTRELGVNVRQYEFNFPLSYNFLLFKDYLNLELKNTLYTTGVEYIDNYEYKDELYRKRAQSYAHQHFSISLGSDLAKPYRSFYHTLSLKTTLNLPGLDEGDIDERIFKPHVYERDRKNGNISLLALKNRADDLYYEDNFIIKAGKEFNDKIADVELGEYFFDKEGKKRVRHGMKQGYNLDEKELKNFKHILDFYLKSGITVGNWFEYNYKFKELSKSQTYFKFHNPKLTTWLSHSYSKERKSYDDKVINRSNFLIFDGSTKVTNANTLFTRVEYDLEEEYLKMYRVGLTHSRKCWNFTLFFQENIEPKTTNKPRYRVAKKDQGVYLFVNFYPFGGVNYDYLKSRDNWSY